MRYFVSRRLVAVLCVFTIFVSCICVSASAMAPDDAHGASGLCAVDSGTFVDVPECHVYFDAVESIHKKGISKGIGDNKFGVDDKISVKALCVFAVKAFMPRLESNPGFTSAFEALSEIEYLPSWVEEISPVRFDIGLLILGRAAGILPVGIDASQAYIGADVYQYMRDVGGELGILDIAGKSPDASMTRGDAAYIINQLLNWFALESTQELSRTERYGFHYIDIRATEKYEKLLPQLYASTIQLPFKTLKIFHDIGAHVEADNVHIDDYNKRNKNVQAVALFSQARKTIWTVVGDALPHEMGHFTQFVIMNDRDGIKSIYNQEKNKLSALVPIYAKVNSDEYFAEFFGTYIANQHNDDNLAKLKSNMPETFQYFEGLKAANWETEKSRHNLTASSVFY